MASQQQISRYTAQSAFIFVGRVVKLKAATIAGIGTADTAIVQVDHVVTAPAIFSAITGAQITVRFKDLSDVKRGSTLTFYCNGWIYGAGLAVDAVGYHEETPKQQAASMVRSAHSSAKDSVLGARLESAEIGVVGTVTSVQQREVETTRISEHDPAWHEATIKVDEVVKGKKDTREVTVVFPQSDDVRWHKVAKYTEGQQGIWLLHKAARQDTKGIAPKVLAALPAAADALTAVHSADFLPLDELGRVKALLQE
jgi:hypothetical protein